MNAIAMPVPANEEAEQHLLGMILSSAANYERASDLLRAEMFDAPVHRRIFAAIGKIVEEGRQPSPVSLFALFKEDADLNQVGGSSYIAELASCVSAPANLPEYCHVIRDGFYRRRLISMASRATEAAMNPAASVEEVFAALESDLDEAATDAEGGKKVRSLADAIGSLEAEWQALREGKMLSVPTGLRDLDEALGGMKPGQLIIVGGRASMGKTAFACSVALNAALAGKSVLVNSMEMRSEELAQRWLTTLTKNNARMLQRGEGNSTTYAEARMRLAGLRLAVDDAAGLTVAQIANRARRHKRRHGLDLLLVDYIGLVRPSPSSAKSPRWEQVTEISGALKRLARELEIPVVALAQINRAAEGSEDKRPTLATLRDSGSLEQDADAVMLLYRPEYYMRHPPEQKPGGDPSKKMKALNDWHEKKAEVANICEIEIAKNRQGPTGPINAYCDLSINLFADLAR